MTAPKKCAYCTVADTVLLLQKKQCMFSESNADGESIPGGCCPNRRADEANATITSLQARVDELEGQHDPVKARMESELLQCRQEIEYHKQTIRSLEHGLVSLKKQIDGPDLQRLWWQAFLKHDGEWTEPDCRKQADAAIAVYQDKFEVTPDE